MSVHEKKKPYSCTKCPDRHFSNLSRLRTHVIAVHEKKFSCTQCETLLSTEKQLKEHIIKVHEEKKVKLKTCMECNKTFRQMQWVKHMNMFHSSKWIKKNVENEKQKSCKETFVTLD